MRDWMELNGDGEIDSSENNKDDFDQKKVLRVRLYDLTGMLPGEVILF